MDSINKSIPPIQAHAENDIEIKDSCNCCHDYSVSCCLPFRAKKHRKHHQDHTIHKVESEYSNTFSNKKNNLSNNDD